MRLGRNVTRMGETKNDSRNRPHRRMMIRIKDCGATVRTFINLLKRRLLMKTAMIFRFRRGNEYSKLNKHLILSLNSHHTSMRMFGATASSAPCFNSSRNPSVEFNILQLGFTLQGFTDGLGTFSFGSKTRVTSNKRVVQYMPK
jgi:hypothetical protein